LGGDISTHCSFFSVQRVFEIPCKKARQCFSLVPGKDLDKEALREGFGKCMHVDLPAWKNETFSCALCAAIFTRQCLFLLLQEGWEILPNEADGRPYYVNEATGASQWEQPSAS